MGQLVYTIFISNNRTSFHLWLNENLVKHRHVPRYYGSDYVQNFLLFFVFLLTAKLVKDRQIYIKLSLSFQ